MAPDDIVWRHDGERRSSYAASCQSEQFLIAGDQQIGVASGRKGQEFLVVDIPTSWQIERACVVSRIVIDYRQQTAIGGEQPVLSVRLQAELRVGKYALQLVEAGLIAVAAEPAGLDGML